MPHKSVAKYINFNIITQLLILYRKAEHQPISFSFFQLREGKPEQKNEVQINPKIKNISLLIIFPLLSDLFC